MPALLGLAIPDAALMPLQHAQERRLEEVARYSEHVPDRRGRSEEVEEVPIT